MFNFVHYICLGVQRDTQCHVFVCSCSVQCVLYCTKRASWLKWNVSFIWEGLGLSHDKDHMR